MKQVIILRGLPGSGKSTRAVCLREQAWQRGQSAIVHSTDEFFVRLGWFDKSRLGAFHDRNFQYFVESLCAGFNCVIVDNCNVQYRDYERYALAAEMFGYEVTIVTLDSAPVAVLAKRNIHNVPLEFIERMSERWEE